MMGYNTPVLLLNDGMHEIANDPTLAKRMAQASATAHMIGKAVDVSAGNHSNAVSVLPSAHADIVQVIAFGGNHATILGSFMNGGHHYTIDDQIELVRKLADKLGYRLTKKAAK